MSNQLIENARKEVIPYDDFLKLSTKDQATKLQVWRTKFSNNVVIDVWGISRSKYYNEVNKLNLPVGDSPKKKSPIQEAIERKIPTLESFKSLPLDNQRDTLIQLKETLGEKAIMSSWDMKALQFWALYKSLGCMDVKEEIKPSTPTPEVQAVEKLESNRKKGIKGYNLTDEEIKERLVQIINKGQSRSIAFQDIALAVDKSLPAFRKKVAQLTLLDKVFAINIGYKNGVALNKKEAIQQRVEYYTQKEEEEKLLRQQQLQQQHTDAHNPTPQVVQTNTQSTTYIPIVPDNYDSNSNTNIENSIYTVPSNEFETPNVVDGFQMVVQTFAERWYKPNTSDIEALREQFIILQHRGQDSVFWLTTIIKEIAKKSPEKRSIGYLISRIRNRLHRGWGVLRFEDEDNIIREIENYIGHTLTQEQCTKVFQLMGKHGAVKIALSLAKMNIADLFLKQLNEHLEETYQPRLNSYSS